LGYLIDKLTAVFPLAAPYLKRVQGEGAGATLVRGAGGAFMVNVVGTGLTFAAHVVLARTTGTSSYGNFVYAITWLNLLVLFAKLGQDTASMRFVAEYNGTGKWGLLQGFVKRSTQVSFATSLFVAGTTAGAIWLVRDRLDPELATAFWLVCLILPLHALLLVRSAALRGLKKVVKAQAAIKIMRPAVLVLLVGVVYYLWRDVLNATTAMAVNLAAFAGSLLFAAYYFAKAYPSKAAESKPEFMSSTWVRVAIPMLFISAMTQAQNRADLLVLGVFLDASQVGIYGAVKNITLLIGFGLAAVNNIAGPLISEMWHQGRKEELQRVLTLAAKGIVLFTIPMSIIMVVFGKHVLALFGPDFTLAYWPLIILVGAQTLNSLAGSVGLIMVMTGHQRNASLIVLVSLLMNVVLSVLLIPEHGITGAALAMAVSYSLLNLLMLVYIFRKLGLNPSIVQWKKSHKPLERN